MSKILFPTDFSHTGDAALEYAASMARDRGATLLIVHVEEPPIAYAGGEFYYGLPNPTPAELRGLLEDVKPSDPGVPVERRLVSGHPATAVCRIAKDEDVECIVIGTHGRTGLTRLLMGSVAEEIVRHAPCPVLTFRNKAGHPAKATT